MAHKHTATLAHAPEPRAGMQIAAASLLGFGLTLLLMSLAYQRDLDLLRQAPEALWQFLCGAPAQDGVTLPLMLALSVAALLAGGALLALSRRPRRAR